MQDADRFNRPVNIWYPRNSPAPTAGKVGCERVSNAGKARLRAEELIRCGAAVGPVQIEDVETGAIVERVTRGQ